MSPFSDPIGATFSAAMQAWSDVQTFWRTIAMPAVVAVAAIFMTPVFGQPSVATPAKEATVSVAMPAHELKGWYLDIGVQAFTPPKQGTVSAVVTVATERGEQEVGRFAIFPTEGFVGDKPGELRTFRLDASEALRKLAAGPGPVAVKVKLVPDDAGAAVEGAQLTVGGATFTPRE
jgi:hypothetical protein